VESRSLEGLSTLGNRGEGSCWESREESKRFAKDMGSAVDNIVGA